VAAAPAPAADAAVSGGGGATAGDAGVTASAETGADVTGEAAVEVAAR
jgi:hypothetical protein